MERAKPAVWKEYFENRKNKPPRPLLVRALEFVKNKDTALDFGAGSLNDSIYLLEQGFKCVVALDKNDATQLIAREAPKDRFEYVVSPFEEYDFPTERFDLVNAQYALPFINPKSFEGVFGKIYSSLKPGGILTGQFFGDRDEWRNESHMTYVSLAEANKLLKPFKPLSFEEEEKDDTTALGKMKHWHLFHFIAEK